MDWELGMKGAGGFILWESLVGMAILVAALAVLAASSREVLMLSRPEALEHYVALVEFEEGGAGVPGFELVSSKEDLPGGKPEDWQRQWHVRIYRRWDEASGKECWIGTRLERN